VSLIPKEAVSEKYLTLHKNAFLWTPSDRNCGQSHGGGTPAGVVPAPLVFSGRMRFLALEQQLLFFAEKNKTKNKT
jgi:hypothetical protein